MFQSYLLLHELKKAVSLKFYKIKLILLTNNLRVYIIYSQTVGRISKTNLLLSNLSNVIETRDKQPLTGGKTKIIHYLNIYIYFFLI